MKIINLDCIDSTNDYAKTLTLSEDTIIFANSQSSGRGTKGRSFISTEGGIYLSYLRFYNNMPATAAFKIMINSAVAVCKTCETCGVTPIIKWANDVLVNGRKLSGTLIENTFSGKNIARSIVGIGLNVNNTLPEELKCIATSLKNETNRLFNIDEIKKILAENLQKEYTIMDYKGYIDWFGKEVELIMADKTVSAVAKDIAPDGSLICMIDGKLEAVRSAEVSLRLA